MTGTEPGGGAPLLSFAVVADTHINPEDDRSSSPWPTNRHANARAAAVVETIKAMRPRFVVHVGDIVHPTPANPRFAEAVARFRALFANLDAPLHLVSGNHDVGDKPTAWSPAACITGEYLHQYREHFGPDHYAFDVDDCRFVILNSQLMNSGLPDEEVQWNWLGEQLIGARRLFLFKHYPPFLCDEGEPEHYDNVAEPARSRLLALLRRHHVEALFCGHVHNYFYNRWGETDCYVLPATSAVRHDYMELFPVPPGVDADHGRDARTKLGFFWVDVHADRHVAHWVRSFGATRIPGTITSLRPPRVHALGPLPAPLGVDLRHGWADRISIPYTGVVDEFGRKQARNDYMLAALWETGIAHLRVPIHDIVDPIVAPRLAQLAARGHRFTVFSFGAPEADQVRALARLAPAVAAVEIVERPLALEALRDTLPDLRSAIGTALFASPLHSPGDDHGDRERFAHAIRHGFSDERASLPPAGPAWQAWDGLVFRIDRREPLLARMARIVDALRARDRRGIVHVILAGEDPARALVDDVDTAGRVADATLAAWLHRDCLSVFIDTFDDHDRGYHPRHGLVDRVCDSRPAAVVVRTLTEALGGVDPGRVEVEIGPGFRAIRGAGRSLVIAMPDRVASWTPPADLARGDARITGIRLDTGTPMVEGQAMPAAVDVPLALLRIDARERVSA